MRRARSAVVVAARFVAAVLLLLTVGSRIAAEPAYGTPEAQAFHDALMQAGFAYPLLSLGEVVVAVLLLWPRFVPLGTILLAPIVAAVATFNLTLNPNAGGLGPTGVLVTCFAILAWRHRTWLLRPPHDDSPADGT